jgi:hypothetical protein
MHAVTVAQVEKLAGALARHTGQREEEARAHLFSRLGVVLQRGNGAILANRIPHFPDSQTDGDQ